MPVPQPICRTYRQFINGSYDEGGRSNYVEHPSFAQSPERFIRAFLILQKDLIELFDYIEPSDKNLKCFSYRIHALLMRACIEFEANCKAIFRENKFQKTDTNIKDYWKIEDTHLLSKYEVKVPYWAGKKNIYYPFKNWEISHSLSWYGAYNESKHDRHNQFEKANFENLLNAVCGLLVILSSQFGTHDFSPSLSCLAIEGGGDGMESGIGGYFRIKFPVNFPQELRYDFDWHLLKDQDNPFEKCDYSKIIKK